METKKIRIGNDIRLAVNLSLYIGGNFLLERSVYNPGDPNYENLDNNPFVNKQYEVYYPFETWPVGDGNSEYTSTANTISIRSVKAFLINTTRQEEYKEALRKKSRFISRFPIEPYIEAFHATPYDICNSGYPTWRAYPRHHAFVPYHGFGVYPDWPNIYKPLPVVNDMEYVANVAATDKLNVVEVLFPARHLLHVGKYKLVIVAKVYAPGYNERNLKTITVDVPDVFELVRTTEEGVDTGIQIGVNVAFDDLSGNGNGSDVLYDDVYVNNGSVSNDQVVLGRTDGNNVNVDMSSIAGWYEGD